MNDGPSAKSSQIPDCKVNHRCSTLRIQNQWPGCHRERLRHHCYTGTCESGASSCRIDVTIKGILSSVVSVQSPTESKRNKPGRPSTFWFHAISHSCEVIRDLPLFQGRYPHSLGNSQSTYARDTCAHHVIQYHRSGRRRSGLCL